MSELITQRSTPISRWHLLTTASVLVLAATGMSSAAFAGERDDSTVWLELGGQLERVDGNSLPFVPEFSPAAIEHGFSPPASVQKGGRYNYGGEGAIQFNPGGSKWHFRASVRYGRSNASKSNHQQAKAPGTRNPVCGNPATCQYMFYPARSYATADNHWKFSRNTAIVDFQAGKDVGLGLFAHGTSSLDLGVRFAQFTSSSSLNAYGSPYPHFGKKYIPAFQISFPFASIHRYHATASAKRSFSGVGPSVSWKGSEDIVDSRPDEPAIEVGFGINAALLFGRQKVTGHIHTKEQFYTLGRLGAGSGYRYNTQDIDRSRSVIVPNVGGDVSLSLKFPNARVSFGYRADFFFGAMDAGLQLARRRTTSFHGPFATISIGLP